MFPLFLDVGDFHLRKDKRNTETQQRALFIHLISVLWCGVGDVTERDTVLLSEVCHLPSLICNLMIHFCTECLEQCVCRWLWYSRVNGSGTDGSYLCQFIQGLHHISLDGELKQNELLGKFVLCLATQLQHFSEVAKERAERWSRPWPIRTLQLIQEVLQTRKVINFPHMKQSVNE